MTVRKKKSQDRQANLPSGGTILRIGPSDELRYGRLSTAGRLLTALGVFLVGFYAGSVIHRVVSSHLALQEFDKRRAIAKSHSEETPIKLQFHQPMDFSRWSDQRILAYGQNPPSKKGAPLAVLRFERLKLRVPVFEGTDDWTLNRGAGWIASTTRPGEAGNIGIAAHRDSFFRALEDIREGDVMELASSDRTDEYTVDQVEIVSPEDVSVLGTRPLPSLTLVTCYPFYFVGNAPSRFIVHAAINRQAGNSTFWN